MPEMEIIWSDDLMIAGSFIETKNLPAGRQGWF